MVELGRVGQVHLAALSVNMMDLLTHQDFYCLRRRFRKGAPCVKGPLMNNLERFMSSLASKVVVGTKVLCNKVLWWALFKNHNLKFGLVCANFT